MVKVSSKIITELTTSIGLYSIFALLCITTPAIGVRGMPIPPFDHNSVLPPHLGDPRKPTDVSPYPCTIMELCQRFAISAERIKILKGFIAFRSRFATYNIQGFQWLDGSFLEDIEALEKRPPRDLDVITFYDGSIANIAKIQHEFIDFADFRVSKAHYSLDHYPVNYAFSPMATMENTRYWLQLFTHNRLGVWKGILRIEGNTPVEDKAALAFLDSVVI